MKKNLKPYVYKLWNNYQKLNRVLFVERSGELPVQARLSAKRREAEGKPSLNRAKNFSSLVCTGRPETG